MDTNKMKSCIGNIEIDGLMIGRVVSFSLTMGREQTAALTSTHWSGRVETHFENSNEQQALLVSNTELTFIFFLDGEIHGDVVTAGKAYIIAVDELNDLERVVFFNGKGKLNIYPHSNNINNAK